MKSELLVIPGIGKSIAVDLNQIGIYKVSDLKAKDPQKLYDDFCQKAGYRADPCLLYTFRCAVYFATNSQHEPELLKWWNWKDRG